ncbi:MAG: hypothetical protein QOJ35_2049 [Solirubrobacteraceae bacterium]|jgi:Tfp pilus assembly protein PilV|nr:hypothetical protein [Solirubrobacteraceae bacterium]
MGDRPHVIRGALGGEDGFTIAESMIAAVVLVVGLLGVVGMLIGSLRGTSANNARIAATNLARELVEGARSLNYDDMTGSLVQTRLQARGLGSGTPWTIVRRGVTFTITSTSCTYDDPADRLAANPPANACATASGTTGDANGDDFRRTRFQLTWNEPGAGQRSLQQTALVVNPTGGLGPRISSITPVTQTIIADGPVSITWNTTTAQTMRWVADDGVGAGTVTGTPNAGTGGTSFATSWNVGVSSPPTTTPRAGEVLDGAYQITAQPYDDRGIAGEAKRANVVLNRRAPYAPTGFAGGHNTRGGDWVELQWSPNNERDVLGYRATWAGLDNTVGTIDDVQVCPLLGLGTMLDATSTSCVDLSPSLGPLLSSKYSLVAVDRDRNGALRYGDPATLTIAPASSRPHTPTGPFTVQTVNNQPKLTWNAPSQGAVSFYRIYRGDGLLSGTRYDRTSDNSTTFTDGGAGTDSHQYWISAVDSTFNESDLAGPVSWP